MNKIFLAFSIIFIVVGLVLCNVSEINGYYRKEIVKKTESYTQTTHESKLTPIIVYPFIPYGIMLCVLGILLLLFNSKRFSVSKNRYKK